MTTLSPLSQEHHDLLTLITHGNTNLFTDLRDGTWSTSSPHHQRLVETLGGRALLTTVPVTGATREWVLTRLGARAHNAQCAECAALGQMQVAG